MAVAYGGPRYTDLRRIEPIHGDAQAGAQKATVCLSCHGADGVSVAPTFPRLAGQREDYLYHRLYSFRHANPKDPYYSVSPMTAMAATLSDTDMRDLAAYFASRTPRVPDVPGESAGPGAAGAPAIGERLFLKGDPAHGVPPCQGCHGADANGPDSTLDQYAAYPSLRGQYAPYVVARLTHYHEGQPSDTSNTFIMKGVAQSLDDESMQAIAGWLNSLPPAKSL
jgi:cytochrome c553